MGRILFFVLLAIAIYIAWRVLWAPNARRSRAASSGTPAPQAQAMVSCAVCGLHLPRPDAIADGDRYFCCEEHRTRAPAK